MSTLRPSSESSVEVPSCEALGESEELDPSMMDGGRMMSGFLADVSGGRGLRGVWWWVQGGESNLQLRGCRVVSARSQHTTGDC